MARVAVGGFQHETNTFSPHLATLAHFEAADAWPGLTRGPAVFDAVAGINLPAAGFIAEARGLRHELVPLTWCSAQPSGRVTREAFEHVAALLLDDLRAQHRSMRCTSICTVRWWPNTSTMLTANCWAACARWSGPTCPSSRASISTPTCRR